MPIYRVQGPDGRIYKIEGPEGASEAALTNAAFEHSLSIVKPEEKPVERSKLRELADIPLKTSEGAIAGVRMIADAFGANNPVSKNLRSVEGYIADLYSAQSKADSQRVAEIMKEAEDKGVGENLRAAWESFKLAPVDLLSNALGTAAPTILGGVGAGALKLGTMGVRATQLGIGATTGAGVTKGSIYDSVKRELTNAGMPADQVEARAQLAQQYQGENLDQILAGTALGGIAATTGIESKFLPGITNKILGRAGAAETRSALKEAGISGVKEAVPEALQGSQEQLAQNLALQREGFDVPTMRGVVGQGALEGLAGFGVGAPVGGISQANTNAALYNQEIAEQNRIEQELAPINAERQRIAGIAATAQQQALVRQQAEQATLAEQEKARQDYEASLRVPLTQQTELDLAPETTVEEVASQRAAQSPQGDLFAEPVAPVAEAEPSLNEDTIKSFGFKKNSLAYKAMEALNNPEITPAEQAKRFDQIIENNQDKIKSTEQEEAINKFKTFMDQRLEKERVDELGTVDNQAVGTSADLFGGPVAGEPTGGIGEPVGAGVAGVGTDVGTAEVGADEGATALAQEPESTEVIAEPIVQRPTPEERQQRIIQQRLEEEAARKAEKEANLAETKAFEAGRRTEELAPVSEMPEAEREGLEAAKDVDMSQRMEQGVGTTPAQIQDALQDWYIDPTAAKQAAKIVNTVNELPPNVSRIIGQKARDRGITPGAIQAFTHEGTAYLIADRIKPGTERSVFMHEVGAHLGLKPAEVNSLANKINKWANAAGGTIEREVYNAVQQRMESAKELSNEELVAYTVEEAANRGVTPQAVLRAKAAPPNTVAGIVRYLAEKFMEASKAAFNAFTSAPTPQDLIDYVYGSTRKVLQEGPAKVEEESRLSAASTEPTGDNIFRELVTPRVRDARLNLGAILNKLTPKLLSMYMLVDQYGDSGKDGKFGEALKTYVDLNDGMTMEQQRLKQQAHALLMDWGQFAKQQDAMAKRLNTLMQEATRSRIHPDVGFPDGTPNTEPNAHLTEEDRIKHEALSNAYATLSPEAKQIYQRARQMLQDNFRLRSTRYRQMVQDSYATELANADEAGKQRIEAKMEKAIKEHEMLLNEMRGPYFPLMRFGEFLVIAESDELRELREELKDAVGEERKKLIGRLQQMEKSEDHYSVYAFEKRSQQAQKANELKNKGLNIRESLSEEYMNSTRASTFGAIDQLEKIFDREIDLDIEKDQASKLRQAMIDSVLAGLPENSALQRQIKRRNIAGATDNMLRAFAETMERDSHYISRMGAMKPISKALINMRKQSADDMKLRSIYNTIRRHIDMNMRNDNHPWLSKATGLSSIYHLGIAPSYLLQNMTQPFMISLPQYAGEYGAAKTSKAFIDAWKDSIKAIRGGRNGKFFSLKDTDLSQAFSGDELRMVELLQDLGKLDIANNMDTEVYTKGMSPRWIKFWNVFNWSSHNIELTNRLTTALAVYRLAINDGKSSEAATKAAREAVELTQLDYSDTNAAYVMKQGHMGGLNRIPMQFRKYQHGMLFLLARNFKNAWGGDKAAKKAFFYLMGTQLLMAGVRGVPVAAPLLFLMGAFGDDDDKEGDLETQLRNALADTVGPEAARVFWKGLPAMMGLDSGSLSMENLFLPFPMMRSNAITDAATGKDAVTELMYNIGGAPVSMASRLMDSYLLMTEGDYQKGIEKALPKFMSSLVKAERLGDEGITTRSGNVAIEGEEFSAWDQAIKAMGFTPTKESEYYQAMYAKERISQAIDDRRNRIIKAMAKARLNGEVDQEALEQAKEFNSEHPSRRITGESITRSVAQRRKDKQQRAESGVRYEKRERDIRDVTRYAN